jgi:ABC-2 type transport system permease protein
MFSILKKEFSSFFSNATGYIVIGIFLTLTGLFLWVIPGEYNVFDNGYANLDGLFYLAPWLFLFLCPAVTMRLFAEEKQTGTWELIITKPISKLQIVLGKYIAALLLVLIALLPTLIYYYSISNLAEPAGNVDSGAFWGSFIGLVFLAASYVSIGTFASSLSKNQIVAFVLAIVISFFFYYGFEVLTNFITAGQTIQIVDTLGIHAHYKSMSRGVIDSRDLLYFIVLSSGFLAATVWKIRK